MAISPDLFLGEAVGRFRVRRAVLFGIVVFASNSGSCWTGASVRVARGEPWFYLRLGPKPA